MVSRGLEVANEAKFVQARQPDTPRLLSHYTKQKNVFGMLDVGIKSVCFWLKNNRSIKLKDEWETEVEWRYVLHKQENDERYFHDSDGFERLKMFVPIKYLTGITLLYDENSKETMKRFQRGLKNYRNWSRLGRFNVKLMKIK